MFILASIFLVTEEEAIVKSTFSGILKVVSTLIIYVTWQLKFSTASNLTGFAIVKNTNEWDHLAFKWEIVNKEYGSS